METGVQDKNGNVIIKVPMLTIPGKNLMCTMRVYDSNGKVVKKDRLDNHELNETAKQCESLTEWVKVLSAKENIQMVNPNSKTEFSTENLRESTI